VTHFEVWSLTELTDGFGSGPLHYTLSSPDRWRLQAVVQSASDTITINVELKLPNFLAVKGLIELSLEQYESLLKRATEESPLYFRLKNARKD
jgi:hypothetical protein